MTQVTHCTDNVLLSVPVSGRFALATLSGDSEIFTGAIAFCTVTHHMVCQLFTLFLYFSRVTVCKDKIHQYHQ